MKFIQQATVNRQDLLLSTAYKDIEEEKLLSSKIDFESGSHPKWNEDFEFDFQVFASATLILLRMYTGLAT